MAFPTRRRWLSNGNNFWKLAKLNARAREKRKRRLSTGQVMDFELGGCASHRANRASGVETRWCDNSATCFETGNRKRISGGIERDWRGHSRRPRGAEYSSL